MGDKAANHRVMVDQHPQFVDPRLPFSPQEMSDPMRAGLQNPIDPKFPSNVQQRLPYSAGYGPRIPVFDNIRPSIDSQYSKGAQTVTPSQPQQVAKMSIATAITGIPQSLSTTPQVPGSFQPQNVHSPTPVNHPVLQQSKILADVKPANFLSNNSILNTSVGRTHLKGSGIVNPLLPNHPDNQNGRNPVKPHRDIPVLPGHINYPRHGSLPDQPPLSGIVYPTTGQREIEFATKPPQHQRINQDPRDLHASPIYAQTHGHQLLNTRQVFPGINSKQSGLDGENQTLQNFPIMPNSPNRCSFDPKCIKQSNYPQQPTPHQTLYRQPIPRQPTDSNFSLLAPHQYQSPQVAQQVPSQIQPPHHNTNFQTGRFPQPNNLPVNQSLQPMYPHGQQSQLAQTVLPNPVIMPEKLDLKELSQFPDVQNIVQHMPAQQALNNIKQPIKQHQSQYKNITEPHNINFQQLGNNQFQQPIITNCHHLPMPNQGQGQTIQSSSHHQFHQDVKPIQSIHNMPQKSTQTLNTIASPLHRLNDKGFVNQNINQKIVIQGQGYHTSQPNQSSSPSNQFLHHGLSSCQTGISYTAIETPAYHHAYRPSITCVDSKQNILPNSFQHFGFSNNRPPISAAGAPNVTSQNVYNHPNLAKPPQTAHQGPISTYPLSSPYGKLLSSRPVMSHRHDPVISGILQNVPSYPHASPLASFSDISQVNNLHQFQMHQVILQQQQMMSLMHTQQTQQRKDEYEKIQRLQIEMAEQQKKFEKMVHENEQKSVAENKGEQERLDKQQREIDQQKAALADLLAQQEVYQEKIKAMEQEQMRQKLISSEQAEKTQGFHDQHALLSITKSATDHKIHTSMTAGSPAGESPSLVPDYPSMHPGFLPSAASNAQDKSSTKSEGKLDNVSENFSNAALINIESAVSKFVAQSELVTSKVNDNEFSTSVASLSTELKSTMLEHIDTFGKKSHVAVTDNVSRDCSVVETSATNESISTPPFYEPKVDAEGCSVEMTTCIGEIYSIDSNVKDSLEEGNVTKEASNAGEVDVSCDTNNDDLILPRPSFQEKSHVQVDNTSLHEMSAHEPENNPDFEVVDTSLVSESELPGVLVINSPVPTTPNLSIPKMKFKSPSPQKETSPNKHDTLDSPKTPLTKLTVERMKSNLSPVTGHIVVSACRPISGGTRSRSEDEPQSFRSKLNSGEISPNRRLGTSQSFDLIPVRGDFRRTSSLQLDDTEIESNSSESPSYDRQLARMSFITGGDDDILWRRYLKDLEANADRLHNECVALSKAGSEEGSFNAVWIVSNVCLILMLDSLCATYSS